MKKDKAIKVLEDFITVDRVLRNGNTESDYEQFCEDRCIAIETILACERKNHIELLKIKNEMKKIDKEAQKYFEDSLEKIRLIDIMADWIAKTDLDEEICSKKTSDCYADNFVTDCCKNCVIDYFRDKLKED